MPRPRIRPAEVQSLPRAAPARTTKVGSAGPSAATATRGAPGAPGAHGWISIRGARQNNLRGVDVAIPRNALVAITGVSGSGKSSLAFDTLYREGQRRFLETLSAYARQFLGGLEKPEVDHIAGLSPAIAVDQDTLPRGQRSTVGTLTEIHDHLRVLFARAGVPHCPEHGTPLAGRTREELVAEVAARFAGRRVLVLAPLVRDRKGEHRGVFADLARRGFVRARVDGAVVRVEEAPALERYKRHSIEAVVDRLEIERGAAPGGAGAARLRDALQQALELGHGELLIEAGGELAAFSTSRACPRCGAEAPPLEPRLFSFNSPHGACPRCQGLGVLSAPSAESVVRDASLSVRGGALAVTLQSGDGLLFPHVDFGFLEAVAERHGFSLDVPWRELPARAQRVLLEGSGEERYRAVARWAGERSQGAVSWERRWRGVLPALARALERGQRRSYVARLASSGPCRECGGTRLARFARAVRVGGLTIGELLARPIAGLGPLLDSLALAPRERAVAAPLVTEIRRRLDFLVDVGLGYLDLGRGAETLSGGEAQRIRLGAQLGARLSGVLYVLDEPSIGLHPRDHGKLLESLRALCGAGNTVVVVEHDEATLRAADWLVDVGPLAGREGGRIVASGPPEDVARADSPTGALLRGELALPAPARRRAPNGRAVELLGCRGHNLKDVDARFPLGVLTVVTGVSGSGKSTLVEGTLERAVRRRLGLQGDAPLVHRGARGLEAIGELVNVDAVPIGRTPRSNPATYTGAAGPIRDLFASLPEARMRGFGPGRFSFNVEGGRCGACLGAGARTVELQFLAPVTVPCEECGGHRFQEETLAVRFRGRSIADVLALTVDEARELFAELPRIARPLDTLARVGLGYLALGQPSTTLSGGEAQRLKLALELQRRPRLGTDQRALYVLDEPTTGLHQADVQKLVGALQELVDQGHAVVVVEHNLDFVRAADWVIDLGPEAGAGGGEIVVQGTPEEVERHGRSHTGAALAADRRRRDAGEAADRSGRRARNGLSASATAAGRGGPAEFGRSGWLEVVGASTHNLKHVDVALPHGRLTVVTGPSGSGKSTLALDTIHAVGRQRFVESLSTYARQFLSSRDRPPVERIDGLTPSVAVEAGAFGSAARSTVATTTEILDHLRVLFARAGEPRCPEHGEVLAPCDASSAARRMLAALAGRRGWLVAPMFDAAAADEHRVPPAAEPGGASAARALEPPAAAARTGAAERRQACAEWKRAGFARVLVDGREQRLDGAALDVPARARLDLVIDRLVFDGPARGRLTEAVEQAAALAGGRALALAEDGTELLVALSGACTRCGFRLAEKLEPRHFSFNTHAGACPACSGLGRRWQCDPALLIDRPELPLAPRDSSAAAAISGKLGRYLVKGKGYYEHLLRAVAKSHRIDLERPYGALGEAARALLERGRGARARYAVEIEKHGATFDLEQSFEATWPGLAGHVDAWHAKSEDPAWRAILEGFMREERCAVCGGTRLAPGPRAVAVAGQSLPEVLALAIGPARAWLAGARGAAERAGVREVVGEIDARLALLERVGLHYLTLDRASSTLSGGEARRVRLSASLGSELVGVTYVLDEPTVGLHPADVERLTGALSELCARGNTVIAVEHDESLMRRADWIVDLGPGSGRAGGSVVAAGTPAEIAAHPSSLTGRALRGELALERPAAAPRGAPRPRVAVRGAALHNLKSIDLEVELGALTGVCGPSGSGKSTLVLECLVPALAGAPPDGRWRAAEGRERRVLVVDSTPLGRTPASVPATAVGVLEPLRELFARTTEARMRGFTAGHFSFNSPRGRCEACEGRGAEQVEMQFLADLWLTCEECRGRRYRPDVLECRWQGRSIADVLESPCSEALALFADHPAVAAPLCSLVDVGLGYLVLGQSSTTLSAGEAQRVKLAAELARAQSGTGSEPGLIVLDEPTTGLHASDVRALHAVLVRLAAAGCGVLVIEHHPALLAACDWLVELGPAGGAAGGSIVARGRPGDLAADPRSPTGPYLAPFLPGVPGVTGVPGARAARAASPAREKPSRSAGRRMRA